MTSYRATTPQALAIPCPLPLCAAKADEPCVYLPLNELAGAQSMRAIARRALTGTPTVRPHNERFTKAWQNAVKAAQAEARREGLKSIAASAATPEMRSIAKAHQAWDRTEWLKLSFWLRRYGSIFQEN